MKENIEEDIEVMANIITHYIEADKCGLSNNDFKKEIKALSNILSDYKRLQEEFKQVDHECEKLEQKELRLEKEVEIAKEALKKQCDIVNERNQLLREKQKLQKENEELNKIKSLIEILKVNAMEDEKYIVITKGSFFDGSFKFLLNDYLPKQKIKDKIEECLEYDKKCKTYTKDGRENFTMEYFKAKVLQDILEEKGE